MAGWTFVGSSTWKMIDSMEWNLEASEGGGKAGWRLFSS